MKKINNTIIFSILFLFFVLLGGSLAMIFYSPVPMDRTDSVPSLAPTKGDAEVPVETVIEGEIVCLPHKDQSGPQTLECAIGLKTDDGVYYALEAGTMSPPAYNTGERIRGKGLLTPIEELSSDHWQKYDVSGIFSIKDSLEVL